MIMPEQLSEDLFIVVPLASLVILKHILNVALQTVEQPTENCMAII